jgi:hypothetical protein
VTTQQLFYQRAVPLSSTRHGNWSLEVSADYGFARNANSVPLVAAEFASAAREYPIVFVPSQGAIVAAALLGPRGGPNRYVGPDGAWRARYVPAFVRRYPFVFASGEDPKTQPLCIDEACPGCNQEGRGERLFDAQGKPTPFIEGRLAFVRDFQVQFDRTLALCARLKELGLFQRMQAKLPMDAAGNTAPTGSFDVVGREKLKALSGAVLARLVESDELELIYLHLQSLRLLATPGRRARAGGAGAATGARG